MTQPTSDPTTAQIIKLAIMAVGGQGGGVLANWIEACARSNGYLVQSTSVAGVAQRTGATIYYIEMTPDLGREPVFSLSPAAGDVDIVVAAELMEAGRAIMRGFVTPDLTTLIASSHRALAISEKMMPGNGIADADAVISAAELAARKFIHFDMEQMAVSSGTVISASLCGALAGTEILPFSRQQFEDAIKASGRGVEPSLAAFDLAYNRAKRPDPQDPVSSAVETTVSQENIPAPLAPGWQTLERRVNDMPAPVRELALPGLKAVVDYQDIVYGNEYLDRLDALLRQDSDQKEFLFSREAAKYLAKSMTYDDVFRVADLKTRGSRFAKVRREMAPGNDVILNMTEFMHPRADELVGMLPRIMGRRVSASSNTMKLIDWLFGRGRRIRTDRLLPFLQLYLIAGLRRWRRGTLRHAIEEKHMQDWLDSAVRFVETDYEFAVELIRNRRLIKGYSDTHARGLTKFDKVGKGAMLVAGRKDAAQWVRRLREAALEDESEAALDGALSTIQSFASEMKAS
ncbi:MAG: indolepyruvate oxidoreductase subunit beta family protein [Hyphomicrobiaceae bacterium]